MQNYKQPIINVFVLEEQDVLATVFSDDGQYAAKDDFVGADEDWGGIS